MTSAASLAVFYAVVDTPPRARQTRLVERRLQLVATQDPASLQRDHGAALRGFAHRLARNDSDADDLVQETFARALAGWSTFKTGTNVRSWLLSILHHVFIDRCRRQALEGNAVSSDEIEHQLAHPEPEPEPVWAQVRPEQVQQALDTLEPAFRDAYRLHAQGKSYDEISRTLGIPRATVGTRLLRARRKLRVVLFGAPEESEAEDAR